MNTKAKDEYQKTWFVVFRGHTAIAMFAKEKMATDWIFECKHRSADTICRRKISFDANVLAALTDSKNIIDDWKFKVEQLEDQQLKASLGVKF